MIRHLQFLLAIVSAGIGGWQVITGNDHGMTLCVLAVVLLNDLRLLALENCVSAMFKALFKVTPHE